MAAKHSTPTRHATKPETTVLQRHADFLPLVRPATAPEVAEPLAPCPTCDRPLWCHFDFAGGDYSYFCPDCDRFGTAG